MKKNLCIGNCPIPFPLYSAVVTVSITEKMFKGECPGILKADQFYYLKNRQISLPIISSGLSSSSGKTVSKPDQLFFRQSFSFVLAS